MNSLPTAALGALDQVPEKPEQRQSDRPGLGAPSADAQGAAALALAALGLCVAAVWILQRPYRGLNHDSVLYALSALAQLHATLAHDVFLRFGSQDSYTVFGPLFAATVRALDLEPAAALLTFLGQVAFFVAGWALARRVMSARLALLAVGVLIALPSDYGALQDFNYIEGFLTPRQMAETLVLASLAATMANRRIIGGICLLVGMLFHPIMAFAGFVILFCLYVAIPRPRLALGITSAILAVTLGAALLVPVGPFRSFDVVWLDRVYANGYLFMSQWSIRDWSHFCVPAGVLIVGMLTSPIPAVKKLCVAALLTAAAGILATLLFCDLLHVVIFTQMQPWRWLWLAQAIAVLLLPLVALDCWRVNRLGRAAIVLLASACALRDLQPASGIVLAAILCAASAQRLKDWRYARLIFVGCSTLLVLAMLINVLPHVLQSAVPTAAPTFSERLVQRVSIWASGGLLYVAILGVMYWLGTRRSTSARGLLLAAATALVCVLAPAGWHSWTAYKYTPASRALYSPWREVIPASAEVFWASSPVSVWYLLERPDYWSPPQSAGDIFSREKALETQRRSLSVLSALDAAGQRHPPDPDPDSPWYRPPHEARPENLDAPAAAALCSDSELSFIVSRISLGPTPFPEVVPNSGEPERRLWLYRCADLRQAAG
jgi:hypothetical protein